jgi:hypothetical protein
MKRMDDAAQVWNIESHGRFPPPSLLERQRLSAKGQANLMRSYEF